MELRRFLRIFIVFKSWKDFAFIFVFTLILFLPFLPFYDLLIIYLDYAYHFVTLYCNFFITSVYVCILITVCCLLFGPKAISTWEINNNNNKIIILFMVSKNQTEKMTANGYSVCSRGRKKTVKNTKQRMVFYLPPGPVPPPGPKII